MSRIGRPPKFQEPGRPVTMVLPETTLARLAMIDSDRARAVVKATEVAIPLKPNTDTGVEIVDVVPGLGIIVIGPSTHLRTIPWLQLVEVAPARFLITIPLGTSIDSLEIVLVELLESRQMQDPREQLLVQRLRDIFRTLRHKGGGLSKAELLLIDSALLGDERTIK